jgi:hypothetical protein
MTDVIIFHTDEQGNKTACIMSIVIQLLMIYLNL